METSKNYLSKQFIDMHNQKILQASIASNRNIVINLDNSVKIYQLMQPYNKPIQKENEEPIDLTQVKNEKPSTSHQYVINSMANKENILPQPKCKRAKPNFQEYIAVDEKQLNSLFKDVIELQATESKQIEILKAAKSLFSKRTGTLYHWMYPNTPKQHIKMAVANSWDNLSTQEKQFYISQVLVRFGFPQCNLMVNPQLGGIKELPPLPDSLEYNNPSSELQTAISSISDVESNPGPTTLSRKRQGRPLGSKNRKLPKCDLMTGRISKDFQDDPELSTELEKFAITFDCFK